MKYFAYGSNMSIARLRERTPSAVSLGRHHLREYDLRFHKSGADQSAKCDALHTGRVSDVVMGVLFEIDPAEKVSLDLAEGLGHGYDEKPVVVTSAVGASVKATTYVATHIDDRLAPYAWYVNHVLVGALEALLPEDYIDRRIRAIAAIEDACRARDARERAIHHGCDLIRNGRV